MSAFNIGRLTMPVFGPARHFAATNIRAVIQEHSGHLLERNAQAFLPDDPSRIPGTCECDSGFQQLNLRQTV